MSDDPRIPVLPSPAAQSGAGIAWLVQQGAPVPAAPHELFQSGRHVPGCACCAGRADVAQALSRLHMRAMRGDMPPLAAVYARCADAAGAAAIIAALTSDRFCAARFRWAGGGVS